MQPRTPSFSDRAYMRDRLVEARNLTITAGMSAAPASDMRVACKALLPALDDVLRELVGEVALGAIKHPPARD